MNENKCNEKNTKRSFSASLKNKILKFNSKISNWKGIVLSLSNKEKHEQKNRIVRNDDNISEDEHTLSKREHTSHASATKEGEIKSLNTYKVINEKSNAVLRQSSKKKRGAAMQEIDSQGRNKLEFIDSEGYTYNNINHIARNEKTNTKEGHFTNRAKMIKSKSNKNADILTKQPDIRHKSKTSKEKYSKHSSDEDYQKKKDLEIRIQSNTSKCSIKNESNKFTYADAGSITFFIVLLITAFIVVSIWTWLSSCIKLLLQICFITKFYDLIKISSFENNKIHRK